MIYGVFAAFITPKDAEYCVDAFGPTRATVTYSHLFLPWLVAESAVYVIVTVLADGFLASYAVLNTFMHIHSFLYYRPIDFSWCGHTISGLLSSLFWRCYHCWVSVHFYWCSNIGYLLVHHRHSYWNEGSVFVCNFQGLHFWCISEVDLSCLCPDFCVRTIGFVKK